MITLGVSVFLVDLSLFVFSFIQLIVWSFFSVLVVRLNHVLLLFSVSLLSFRAFLSSFAVVQSHCSHFESGYCGWFVEQWGFCGCFNIFELICGLLESILASSELFFVYSKLLHGHSESLWLFLSLFVVSFSLFSIKFYTRCCYSVVNI